MTTEADAMKYTAIICFLIGATLCVIAAIAQHQERLALMGQ